MDFVREMLNPEVIAKWLVYTLIMVLILVVVLNACAPSDYGKPVRIVADPTPTRVHDAGWARLASETFRFDDCEAFMVCYDLPGVHGDGCWRMDRLQRDRLCEE